MEITYTAYTLSDSTFYCTMGAFGRGVNVLSSDPTGVVPITQAGQTGTTIVQFPVDGYYRVTASVLTEDEEESAETYLFFRVDQGNVHTIPEQIYQSAVENRFVADIRSKAKGNAHRHLDTLKANGLTIAVENWPHDETNFPVQNNLGLPMETEEEIYAEEFLQTALNDTKYKDTVIVNTNKIYPCYSATISKTPVLAQYQNKLATIHFKAYNAMYKKLQQAYVCRSIKSTTFYLYTRVWVTDVCSNFTYLKTVRYHVMTDESGSATATIAYAPIGAYPDMDPPIIRLTGISALGDVAVGECTTRIVQVENSEGQLDDRPIPWYTEGSESQVLLDTTLRYDNPDFDLGCQYDTGVGFHQVDEWLVTGHLFQANIQGGFLWAGGSHWECRPIDDPATVFTEGFANWFALYTDDALGEPLYLGGNDFCYPYSDNGEIQEGEIYNCSRCKNQSCSSMDDDYKTAGKDEFVIGAFLWDLFDQIDVPYDHTVNNCFVDEREASTGDPDPSGTLYQDEIQITIGALLDWSPAGYHSLNDLLRDWLSTGMPLDGHKDALDSLMKLNYLTPLPVH